MCARSEWVRDFFARLDEETEDPDYLGQVADMRCWVQAYFAGIRFRAMARRLLTMRDNIDGRLRRAGLVGEYDPDCQRWQVWCKDPASRERRLVYRGRLILRFLKRQRLRGLVQSR